MNVLLAPVSGITMFKNVPTVYFPVMWFENAAGVPENLVSQLSLLAKLPTILQGMGWVEVEYWPILFKWYLSLFCRLVLPCQFSSSQDCAS